VEPSRLAGLVQDVLRNEFPEELEIFAIEGQSIVSDALASKKLADKRRGAAEFGMGIDPEHVVQFVKVVTGTVSALGMAKTLLDGKSATPSRGPLDTDTAAYLVKSWEDALVADGITAEKAKRISATFGRQLLELLGPATEE
jgi:hypothetical protein